MSFINFLNIVISLLLHLQHLYIKFIFFIRSCFYNIDQDQLQDYNKVRLLLLMLCKFQIYIYVVHA